MATERHVRVRERAYEIWVQSGQPHGRSDEHWLQAERDVLASETGPKPASRKAASKPAAARTGAAKPKAAAAEKAPAKAGRSAAGSPARRSQAKSAEASPTKH